MCVSFIHASTFYGVLMQLFTFLLMNTQFSILNMKLSLHYHPVMPIKTVQVIISTEYTEPKANTSLRSPMSTLAE